MNQPCAARTRAFAPGASPAVCLGWFRPWFWIGVLVLPAGGLRGVDLPLRWRWSNPTPHGNNVYDMTSGLGLVLQATDSGQLYSSSDQVLWEPHETGTTNAQRGLAFLGERLIITGASGTVLFADSLGDIQAGSLHPPTTKWLNDLTRLSNTNQTWFAVGNQGTVLASVDSLVWTNAGSVTQKSLYAASPNDAGLLLAAGVEGVIVKSQITPLTNAIGIVQYARGLNQSSFLFSGATGQWFTLDRTAGSTNWIAGDGLEFLDGSGTHLCIEPHSPNPPPEEFHRGTRIP